MSEFTDTTKQPTLTHQVVSENGRKYYVINGPGNTDSDGCTSTSSSQEFPIGYDQLELEKSGPLHYYGSQVVVRNAKEMFKRVNILPDGRYFCCVCHRAYKTHSTLTAHLKGTHLRQESACPEPDCNHTSYTEHERRKHQKMHEKNKYSKNSREFLKMEKMKEPLGSPNLPSERSIQDQLALTGNDIAGATTYRDKRGNIRYTCNLCSHPFRTALHVTRHMETHNRYPKQCFYCGEMRNGTMDLHIHYLRCHKNEGVRTITCKACERSYTAPTLFQNHHANQEKCQLAIRNSLLRQDIYYGELPAGTIVDHLTQTRLNFFRKRQEEFAAKQHIDSKMNNVDEGAGIGQSISNTEDEEEGNEYEADIFVGSNSLVQTEFGLKAVDKFKPARATMKREIDDNDRHHCEMKRKRGVISIDNNGHPNNYINHEEYHHNVTSAPAPAPISSQQQNDDIFQNNYIYEPPAFSYDPLIGRYPDFQPLLQSEYYSPYDSEICNGNAFTSQESSSHHQRQKPREEILETGDDDVFEELNKLDYVMPTDNTIIRDDDLGGIFNFK